MSVTASQRLLLDALLLASPAAENCWRKWRASADLDCLDDGSFQLLPALSGRMPAWLIDDPRRAILRGICRRAWSENQVQRKLLAEAVQILAAAGIERVAATGPIVWGPLYWPEGSIRPAGTVDLLIEPAIVRPALEALLGAGWKAVGVIPDSGRKQLYFAAGIPLLSPSGGQVHVHWRALPNTDLSLKRPEFPPLEALPPGLPAKYTLPPEYALAAAIGGVHEDGIHWDCDALMICRRPGLRWEKVAALLKRRSALRRRIEELRREYGVEIPRAVTAPPWTNGLEQMLASALRAYRRRGIE